MSADEHGCGQGRVQHLNPDGLSKNPAFTQVITVSGAARTIYVGGQDAVDASGAIVGKGDLGAQSEQVSPMSRRRWRLPGRAWNTSSSGGSISWRARCCRPGSPPSSGAWGGRPNPPTVTGLFVAGLAHPDFLVEIDAVAVVPE